MTESAPSSELETKKRRSTRIVQAVPLTVMGVDALGRPFQERTSTLIINCHGCRYQSKHYVLKNMWLTFEVPNPEAGQPPRTVRAQAVWIQRPRTVRELFQIGTELEVPGNIWGIAFPPEDWFPFPESAAATVASLPAPDAATPSEEWVLPPAAPREDNVRVLPTPGGPEASLALARQMARVLAEAKQELASAAREATTKTVEEETRSLLAALQEQLKLAAEKSVASAVSSHLDQLLGQASAGIQEAQKAGADTLRQQWGRELERSVEEARKRLSASLAEIEQAHRASFQQQLESDFERAVENLKKLSGEVEARSQSAEASVQRLRKELDESAEALGRQTQEMVTGRVTEAQAHLERLAQSAQSLRDEIHAATTTTQAVWRQWLEADLATAGTHWNGKIKTSLENAAQQAAECLERKAEVAAKRVEEEFATRAAAVHQSFEQTTAEAEHTLGALRATLREENDRAKASLEEIQQATGRMAEYSSRLDALSHATAEELQRRFEAVLASESAELNRRAESVVADMADRLQPVLEAAGQQSVARLASQLEQQLAPHLDRAKEFLQKLAEGEALAEKAVQGYQVRLQQVSEPSIQEWLVRLQEAAGRFEKDFQEAGRAATAKWLAELDTRATDTMHTTFEALYKSSEWYEKKAQKQMQAALEKGLEQASNHLREKAGEISGMFASELDHYSRSYVEHVQGQMDEAARETVESARGKLAQAAETSAASLSDEAHRLAQREFEQFTGSVGLAAEQTTALIEVRAVQTRSKLDAEARHLFGEFQKDLTQEVQRDVAQARQELEEQVAPLQDAWRVEREAQERQFADSMAHWSEESVAGYKKRLENASNSWLVATVTTLNQQSMEMIENLANSAERRLRETCSQVFASVGETLRQRLLELSGGLTGSASPQEQK